jgi:cell division protein FtsB
MKDMRRLLPVFFVVFVIASVCIYFFGDSGLLEYQMLDGYRQALASNVESLQARNENLSQELSSLREDPQRSLVMARGIGLSQPGDRLVKIRGFTLPAASNDVGSLLKLRKSTTSRNTVFKATGLAICCLLTGVAAFGGVLRRRRFEARGRPGR